jgi:3-hydroxybutyryl-CoA dehydrogenase
MTTPQTIGVIGAGTMGSGIAQVCALADLIGLDVLLAVMEVFQRDFNDPKYRPAPLLKEMVAAGKLGRKTGRGFHTYE